MCYKKGCKQFEPSIGRPHYHACLFNFDFPNKTLWRLSRDGKTDLFRSKDLEKLWPYGYSTIGAVTQESAGYVARYVTKKITGEKAKEHYGDKLPEKAFMSQGLGKPWLEKYQDDVFPKGYCTINGAKIKAPRYYETLYKKNNIKGYLKYKRKKRKEVKEKEKREGFESSKRMYDRNKHKELITKKLQRKMENEG